MEQLKQYSVQSCFNHVSTPHYSPIYAQGLDKSREHGEKQYISCLHYQPDLYLST